MVSVFNEDKVHWEVNNRVEIQQSWTKNKSMLLPNNLWRRKLNVISWTIASEIFKSLTLIKAVLNTLLKLTVPWNCIIYY